MRIVLKVVILKLFLSILLPNQLVLYILDPWIVKKFILVLSIYMSQINVFFLLTKFLM